MQAIDNYEEIDLDECSEEELNKILFDDPVNLETGIEALSEKGVIMASLRGKECIPLTIEKEIELFKDLKKSSSSEYIEKRRELSKHYLRFVYSIISKNSYVNDSNISDIFQDAILILYNSIDKFDVEKGVKFCSYVGEAVKHEILKYVAKNSKSYSMPREMVASKDKVVAQIINLSKQGKSYQEISKILGITIEGIESYLRIDKDTVSLYKPMYDDDNESETLSDYIKTSAFLPENSYISNASKMAILKGVRKIIKESKLTENELKYILIKYFSKGQYYTDSDIAKILGVQKQNVNRYKNQAFKKLRTNSYTMKLAGLRSDSDTEKDINRLRALIHYYDSQKKNIFFSSLVGVDDNYNIVALKEYKPKKSKTTA